MKNIRCSIKLLFKISPLLMLLLGLFTALSLGLSPLFSLIDKLLFDIIQQSYGDGLEWKKVLYIVLLYFCYNFFVFALFRIKDITGTYAQTIVSTSLQKKTISRISKIDYDRFEENEFYNYITTVQKEITGGNLLGIYLNSITLISVIATTAFLSYLLFRLSAWAVLLSILCCVPGFLHQASFGKKNWEFNTSKIPLQRKIGYYFSLLSSIGAYRENRIYDTTSVYKEKYSGLFGEYYKELKSFNAKNCWKGVIMAILHAVGTVSVITYAYYQAAQGNISLGDAVLFVGVCQSIYNNVQNAVYTFGSINEARHSVNNILNFLSTSDLNEKKMGEKNTKKIDDEGVEIELTNITYAYPGVDKNVLNGLNLRIKNGEKLAIVGENGSGKTTLAKIILGLYHPQKGTVKINGYDIKTVSNDFRYASVCFQDYCTYSLSVRENVAFGNIANIRDDEDILNAIDMSRLERTSFDNDIDRQVTKVFDTNGVVLSGGQSQKLSLARAFMYKHGLLVLDEPSASLDVVTENEIFDTTLNLMRDSTSIVITHRLANVIHCDRIVYLDSGIICEEGTHNELMMKKGKYAELFSIQAEKYVSEGINGTSIT
ncbi:MAG: ABC transporter ATP-binding protein [Eubacteriales bacterium]|jgi:ABC-type multidrug transport system fused ATPase/permease subunit